MLVEAAKPIALLLCLLSLFALFYTAFLVPAVGWEQRTWDAVTLLSLAAGICFASGMIFRYGDGAGAGPVMHTLPVQVFCWAAGAMVLLFFASWYLETYCIFFKDVRRF